MKTPLQTHMENKSEDGGKTNINKKDLQQEGLKIIVIADFDLKLKFI